MTKPKKKSSSVRSVSALSVAIRTEAEVRASIEIIKQQLEKRSYLAANELKNASMEVLRGQRTGRKYRVPGTKRYYTASAPGEPPAVRTGAFRLSWQPQARVEGNEYVSLIESDLKADRKQYLLGEILEQGTKRMKPRPHHNRIKRKARHGILRIYEQPYF